MTSPSGDPRAGRGGGRARRLAAAGGVAGPAAFVAAWTAGGLRTPGYSPVQEPISRLAAVGSSSRPLMTAGLLAYAAGLAAYAYAAGDPDHPDTGARWPAAINAVATLGVALTPLDGAFGGAPHAVAAGTGYAALAAMPLTAAARLRAANAPRAATAAATIGAAVALCLTTSVVADPATGFWQRAGLTIGDIWLIATATRHLRR